MFRVVGAVLVSMILANPASAEIVPVGGLQLGGQQQSRWLVVLSNGDVYRGENCGPACQPPEAAWTHVANVFSSSGLPQGQLVGLLTNGLHSEVVVMAASGDSFVGNPAGDGWGHVRNIFVGAGRPASVVSGVGGTSDNHTVTTASGDVYNASGSAGVIYLGNVGLPTSVGSGTWGAIKVRYRSKGR